MTQVQKNLQKKVGQQLPVFLVCHGASEESSRKVDPSGPEHQKAEARTDYSLLLRSSLAASAYSQVQDQMSTYATSTYSSQSLTRVAVAGVDSP